MVEKKLGNLTGEVESVVKWKIEATCDEISLGDRKYLPIEVYGEAEKMHRDILQRRSQPIDHLDREIEQIRRLMLRSAQEVINNRWNLTSGDPAAAGQQQQEGIGADGHSNFRFGTLGDLNSINSGAMSRRS